MHAQLTHKRLMMAFALLGLTLGASAALAQRDPLTRRPRAFLGVAVEAAREGDRGGATIREVTPDSPAAHARLKPGDVIVKVGDTDVKDPEDLTAAVAKHKPGEKLTFKVMRDGQEHDMSVALGERPAARRVGTDGGREHAGGFLGVISRPLTADDRDRLGVTADKGVVVAGVMPDSPAEKAGLKRGDVIAAIDGKPIADPAELRHAIHQTGAGKEVALTVLRGKEKSEIRTKLEESPVDGLTMAPFAGGPFTSRFLDADKLGALERRVTELEKRVRELEQKRNPDK